MTQFDWSQFRTGESLSLRLKKSEIDLKAEMNDDGKDFANGGHAWQTRGTAVAGPSILYPPTQMLNLPNEIITHVLHHLDIPPPSSSQALSAPDHNLTHSDQPSLKNVARTSIRLRLLALPILFRHARLDPYQLPQFLLFVTDSDTTRHINTVTAHLQGPCNHIHPAWWSKLLEHLPNLTTLTMLAAPHVFSEVAQLSIDTSHAWAFKIPYHSMTLSYIPDSNKDHTTNTTAPDNNVQNLLTVAPWTDLTFNESSHLPAYSTYEYFLKTPPSLITSIQRHQQHRPPEPLLPRQVPASLAPFLENLLVFRYVAIFPFYNHVDEILKCVRLMKRLKKLFIKLCPEPESTMLQDELERNGANAGRTEGRIDVNDPWNEFETSYSLIPYTINYLATEGSLEEFQTDDVKMVGVRDALVQDIDRRLAALGRWSHVRDGVWVRDAK